MPGRTAAVRRRKVASAISKSTSMPLPQRPLPPRGQSPFQPVAGAGGPVGVRPSAGPPNQIVNRKPKKRRNVIQNAIRGVKPSGPASLY